MQLFLMLIALAIASPPRATGVTLACASEHYDVNAEFVVDFTDEEGQPDSLTTDGLLAFSLAVAGNMNTATVSGNAAAKAAYSAFVECLHDDQIVLGSSMWVLANTTGWSARTHGATWDDSGTTRVLVPDGLQAIGAYTYLRLVDETSTAAGTCAMVNYPVWIVGGDTAIDQLDPVDPADFPGNFCKGDPCSACAMYNPKPPGEPSFISCGCRRGHGTPQNPAGYCNHDTGVGKLGGGAADPLVEF